MADWSTMTTGDLSGGTQAATSGFAAALGARRRRELAQESGQTVAQGRYNSDMIAAGKEELKKAKKQAVIGDIATLAAGAAMMIPGAAPAIAGATGLSPGMTAALMKWAPHLVGNLAGSPSPLVSGAVGAAGDIRDYGLQEDIKKADLAARAKQQAESDERLARMIRGGI